MPMSCSGPLKYFQRVHVIDFGGSLRYSQRTGATGFDGFSEAVAACPGPRILVKPSGIFSTANNNLALAA